MKHSPTVTFQMLKMIVPSNNSHNIAKLFAVLIDKDPKCDQIHTYCQIFNKEKKEVCNYRVTFQHGDKYEKRRAADLKTHLRNYHPDMDSENIPSPHDYLCAWSGVLGIETSKPTITKFISPKSDKQKAFEAYCIWVADTMISYRAIDRSTFRNGFGLHIPEFSASWNRQNVSKQIIITGHKIKMYLKKNCLTVSEKVEPNFIINVCCPLSIISAVLTSKFRDIKNTGSPYCSIESDDWLSNTNQEYTGININF